VRVSTAFDTAAARRDTFAADTGNQSSEGRILCGSGSRATCPGDTTTSCPANPGRYSWSATSAAVDRTAGNCSTVRRSARAPSPSRHRRGRRLRFGRFN